MDDTATTAEALTVCPAMRDIAAATAGLNDTFVNSPAAVCGLVEAAARRGVSADSRDELVAALNVLRVEMHITDEHRVWESLNEMRTR